MGESERFSGELAICQKDQRPSNAVPALNKLHGDTLLRDALDQFSYLMVLGRLLHRHLVELLLQSLDVLLQPLDYFRG